MSPIRLVCLVGYYGFARHLPASDNKYTRWVRPIRRFLCSFLFKRVGHSVNVEKGAIFGSGKNVSIGNFSGLGRNCFISGEVSIGDYVMIGPDVMLLARTHAFDNVNIPIAVQGEGKIRAIKIEGDAWIGARTIILPGVKIGRGVVVGAGSVIAKDVPSFAVVGGNPAKVIRWRKVENREA